MSYDDYNSNGASIVSSSADKVFADLDLKFILHPAYKDIRPITELDAVKNAVRNLVVTNKGERLFQPNVGSGIFDLLFENSDPYTITMVRDQVSDLISAYEPRVGGTNVEVELSDDGNNMHVTITYKITGIDPIQSIDFYLERLR